MVSHAYRLLTTVLSLPPTQQSAGQQRREGQLHSSFQLSPLLRLNLPDRSKAEHAIGITISPTDFFGKRKVCLPGEMSRYPYGAGYALCMPTTEVVHHLPYQSSRTMGLVDHKEGGHITTSWTLKAGCVLQFQFTRTLQSHTVPASHACSKQEVSPLKRHA